MTRQIQLLLFVPWLAVGPSSALMAGEIALTFSGGTVNTVDGNYMAGWRFDVNSDILADGLGVWDNDSDGLSEPHEIGIWTEAGLLVTSGTVAAGVVEPLRERFRIVSIPPVLLEAGTRYRIGGYFSPANSDGVVTALATVSAVPEIDYLDRAFLLGSNGFTFPSGFNSVALDANFGPTFTVVAEPLASPGIALSLIALFVRRRHSRD